MEVCDIDATFAWLENSVEGYPTARPGLLCDEALHVCCVSHVCGIRVFRISTFYVCFVHVATGHGRYMYASCVYVGCMGPGSVHDVWRSRLNLSARLCCCAPE